MKGQETPTLTCLLGISNISQWRLAVSNSHSHSQWTQSSLSHPPFTWGQIQLPEQVVFRIPVRLHLDCKGRLDHLLRICSLFLFLLQYEFIPLLNGFRDVRREHHQPTFFKGRPINKMYFCIRNLACGCYCIAKDVFLLYLAVFYVNTMWPV
jgi:hypothetical protein